MIQQMIREARSDCALTQSAVKCLNRVEVLLSDNVVTFPGVESVEKNNDEVTPEKVLAAAQDRYDELILIGRTKGSNKYECVSTIDIEDTLYHVSRIQHRLNVLLDGL